LLVVILLLICTSVYLRAQWLKRDEATGHLSSLFEAGGTHKGGLLGMGWKAARIGERLSPYIAVSCVVMVRRRRRAPPPPPLPRTPPAFVSVPCALGDVGGALEQGLQVGLELVHAAVPVPGQHIEERSVNEGYVQVRLG
jgi:hypothetical protein